MADAEVCVGAAGVDYVKAVRRFFGVGFVARVRGRLAESRLNAATARIEARAAASGFGANARAAQAAGGQNAAAGFCGAAAAPPPTEEAPTPPTARRHRRASRRR